VETWGSSGSPDVVSGAPGPDPLARSCSYLLPGLWQKCDDAPTICGVLSPAHAKARTRIPGSDCLARRHALLLLRRRLASRFRRPIRERGARAGVRGPVRHEGELLTQDSRIDARPG